MRVVMPTGTASAQIIQTQIMPQAMLKQGTVDFLKLAYSIQNNDYSIQSRMQVVVFMQMLNIRKVYFK